jgi:hypothetical protein
LETIVPAISMYRTSVPVFLKVLNNLHRIVDKTVVYLMERKIDPTV